ncbi:hypothetical protein K7472_08615 [Streptomyces sp. PTM05]|uniref:NB-ARC domain-containing protein n=1 Tax=Streptantibioticus parmotrematis TaxID=2873249 RepID=A0ABS7QRB1_9ACTN|nr:hypothetical protein [Streptantibioticus parmotrematis]MBY8884910.1 hypothetical protein [Streptantibioticus parmotrematis]
MATSLGEPVTGLGTPAAGPARAPGPARTLDELVERLRLLRSDAGDPSYSEIVRRIADIRARRGLPGAERVPGRITVYDCFRTGRRRMDAELLADVVRALGADPAPWRAALRCTLDGAPATASPAVPVKGVPDAAEVDCRGRDRELDRLACLTRGVTVVAGMPGVGKTRLALCAARRVLDRGGCGGHLHVDLRGFDPAGPPADPYAVLGALLRGLEVPREQVRRLGRDERVALYRRLTARRAPLVVLDDAAGPGQVRDLLPASGRTLITSRRALPGLDAGVLTLRPLATHDALAVLAGVVGEERLRAEPRAAERLAALCGGLPLELTTAASQIFRRSGWSLADHVHRLESAPGSLPLRAALDVSYRRLDDPARRMFRLLGLHPGGAITPAAAAAVAACPVPEAAWTLQRLRADHLLFTARGEDGTPRYGLHDLVRQHARRLVAAEVPYSAQREAVGRLLDHCLASGQAARPDQSARLGQPEQPGQPA